MAEQTDEPALIELNSVAIDADDEQAEKEFTNALFNN